jgi:hypothetical protein
MKRIVFFTLMAGLISFAPANAQVGKFLKNVKTSVTNDLLGKPDNAKTRPEPPCACDPADFIIDLGKYKIDYTESTIDVLADGKIIIKDKMNGSYYVVKDGVTEGPIKESDPRVKQFERIVDQDDEKAALLSLYQGYVTKQGERYIINFAGKTYGPYDMINSFALTRSKDKFAASVTETLVIKPNEGKKMEEEMEKAKTEQEKMDLAIKYSQQMQQKMMSSGPTATQPKFVSNVTVNNADVLSVITGSFNTTMKYDDILVTSGNKVMDLEGKTLYTFPNGYYDFGNTFLSSDNSRYANFTYGTITISDGKKLSELFNPLLVKTDGKIFLAYMYYSPKRNAIMQCKIPF